MTSTEDQDNASETTSATYVRPATRFRPDIAAMESRLNALTSTTAEGADEDVRRSQIIDLRSRIKAARSVDESKDASSASIQLPGAPRHTANTKGH